MRNGWLECAIMSGGNIVQKIMIKKTGNGEILSAWRFTETEHGVLVEILNPVALDFSGIVEVVETDAVYRESQTIEEELKKWD